MRRMSLGAATSPCRAPPGSGPVRVAQPPGRQLRRRAEAAAPGDHGRGDAAAGRGEADRDALAGELAVGDADDAHPVAAAQDVGEDEPALRALQDELVRGAARRPSASSRRRPSPTFASPTRRSATFWPSSDTCTRSACWVSVSAVLTCVPGVIFTCADVRREADRRQRVERRLERRGDGASGQRDARRGLNHDDLREVDVRRVDVPRVERERLLDGLVDRQLLSEDGEPGDLRRAGRAAACRPRSDAFA